MNERKKNNKWESDLATGLRTFIAVQSAHVLQGRKAQMEVWSCLLCFHASWLTYVLHLFFAMNQMLCCKNLKIIATPSGLSFSHPHLSLLCEWMKPTLNRFSVYTVLPLNMVIILVMARIVSLTESVSQIICCTHFVSHPHRPSGGWPLSLTDKTHEAQRGQVGCERSPG